MRTLAAVLAFNAVLMLASHSETPEHSGAATDGDAIYEVEEMPAIGYRVVVSSRSGTRKTVGYFALKSDADALIASLRRRPGKVS